MYRHVCTNDYCSFVLGGNQWIVRPRRTPTLQRPLRDKLLRRSLCITFNSRPIGKLPIPLCYAAMYSTHPLCQVFLLLRLSNMTSFAFGCLVHLGFVRHLRSTVQYAYVATSVATSDGTGCSCPCFALAVSFDLLPGHLGNTGFLRRSG
jgi:hypothetical protein